ncbi:lysine N-acyltransferase [Seiridium cupressi]
MAPSTVYLPDGQTFTVQPVFSGLQFKSNDMSLGRAPSPFPPGWTVVMHTEEHDARADLSNGQDQHDTNGGSDEKRTETTTTRLHRYTTPTLHNDTIFISSIVNPSSEDFEPAKSPSRQIALMLWVTLYWYFQQPEPSPHLETAHSRLTPADARPKGEWRIRIKREGVLHSRNMIPKLERMGLISTLDSAVGTSLDENSEGWDHMYVSRQAFWQIPFGLFLFTLQPKRHGSHPGSPVSSRPTSPIRNEPGRRHHSPHPSTSVLLAADLPGGPIPTSLRSLPMHPITPYYSASHMPTHYPPPPLQYVVTNGVRHPLRPKPPRMGEVFYTRYVPSVEKYLSFRVASASQTPVPYLGPTSHGGTKEHGHLTSLSDNALLKMWMSNPRVSKFWGEHQPDFLSNALNSKHSFPAIGLWDGEPFGYFEIYWVKEDHLGKHIRADDYDRGIHVFIGEEWARGRVPQWSSSLAHWIWQSDNRTMSICLEPRIDNDRFIDLLQKEGFCKERQVAFPHKQAWLVRLARDAWTGPRL